MTVPPQPPSDRPVDSSKAFTAEDRLDSWKEIAQYLNRDVRTVQRWEKTAGLPVHRHPESRLRTAYAYRSELDAWWHKQTSAPVVSDEPNAHIVGAAPTDVAPRIAARDRLARRWVAVSLSLVILVGALATLAFVDRSRAPSAPAAPQPLRVLLTGFENQTGDAGLGPMLDELLRKDLTIDDTIEVVSPVRVARLLVLMRRDPGVALTETLGREIGARDDTIALVLAGTVRRIGSGYLVSIRVIDPEDGRLRAAVARQAPDAARMIGTLRDEAVQIRTRILNPAPLVSRRRERFEEVTTPSLPALRLYTEALRAGRRRQWAASELLARRALEVDDTFASAYAWVAWAMRNQGRPASECLALADRAVELSAQTTDRERYFIQGTRANVADDLRAAVAAYEAFMRLVPDDTRVMEVLIDCYARSGRMVDAVSRTVRRADAEPGDFYANLRAAHALRIWHRDAEGARTYLERSNRLMSHDAISDRPFWSAWLSLLPGFDRWLNDDVEGLLQTIQHAESDAAVRIGRERDGLATAVGFSYLAIGRVRQAEAAFRAASAPTRQLNLARLALATGKKARAREWLLQIAGAAAERPALFAAAGLPEEAQAGMRSYFGEHRAGVASVTRGLVLVQRGHPAEAIEPLRQGLDQLRYTGEPEYFWAAEALSQIWRDRNDPARAAAVLDQAIAERSRSYSSARWTGGEWIKVAHELAALYDSSHRAADAARLRTSVRRILRLADPDSFGPSRTHATTPVS